MKKTLALLLFITSVLLSLTGCMQLIGYEEIDYQFYQDTANIKSIDLIKITNSDYDFDDNGDEQITVYEFDVLTTITDINKFLADFGEMLCYKIRKIVDLYPETGEYAVKINYTDGASEISGAYGQIFIIGGTYVISDNVQYFNEDEFNALIEFYVASNNYFEI